MLEHNEQGSDTLFELRICSVMHFAHTNFQYGVLTGRSTMQLQKLHCISERIILAAGGKKRDSTSGSEAIQLGGASFSMASAMYRVLLVLSRPRFFVAFAGRPPCLNNKIASDTCCTILMWSPFTYFKSTVYPLLPPPLPLTWHVWQYIGG